MKLGVVCVAGLLVSCGLAAAQSIQVNKENRTIAITTSDDASALADTAKVSIGFDAYGVTSDATYVEASQTSNRILDAVRASGVKSEAIASSGQGIQPLGEEDKVRFSKGLRFKFTQSWQVSVRAEDAAKLLHLAIEAGANNSGGIEWSLRDTNALEAQAAEKALGHAREIAERMAKGLNARLGSLIYASNQAPVQRFSPALDTAAALVSGRVFKEKVPLAIVPDKVERSATVYAVFSLE